MSSTVFLKHNIQQRLILLDLGNLISFISHHLLLLANLAGHIAHFFFALVVVVRVVVVFGVAGAGHVEVLRCPTTTTQKPLLPSNQLLKRAIIDAGLGLGGDEVF